MLFLSQQLFVRHVRVADEVGFFTRVGTEVEDLLVVVLWPLHVFPLTPHERLAGGNAAIGECDVLNKELAAPRGFFRRELERREIVALHSWRRSMSFRQECVAKGGV